MIGCASSSPPLTPVAVSHRNSPFLGGAASAVPFPNSQSPPTLRLPPRRIGVAAGARAAYASAAAERERESSYTSSAGGYSYSSSSSSTSYSYNRISGFALAAPAPSLYDVLGLSPSATVPEIKAAYRRLARSCHPDASKGEGGASASAEQFMRVHAAYATLSDIEKRAEYDRGLVMSPGIRSVPVYQRPASYPGPGGESAAAAASASTYSASTGFQSAGFGRRTWETDQCW